MRSRDSFGTGRLNAADNTMHGIDYLILAAFLIILLAVGFYFRKRAEGDITSFFLSGRSLPWYIAGTSMIATSFASDTPLWITSLVRKHGIHAVWQFWAPVIGSALGVVLFSRLWRRVGVITDLELIELRYSGRPAACLRGVTAGLFAFILAPLIMAWVVKAMGAISQEAIGIPEQYQVATTVCVIGAAVLICAMSGLYGVVYTDLIQLVVATVGTIILAVLAVWEVGGMTALTSALASNQAWTGSNMAIAPTIGTEPGSVSVWNAIGYFGLLWWLVAQSGGYQSQRILASRDIREASRAQLLYTLVYYAVLAWPWILVALCSIILLPDLSGESQDAIYPRMLVLLLPVGLRGLVVAALVAAFISTISTMFNWSSSYFVNDLYKRFLCRDASDHHYVFVARVATIGVAILAGVISLYAETIQQLLEAYYTVAIAVNLLALMRWFWWRLNALGELSGIVCAWAVTILLLQAKLFDAPAREILGLADTTEFSTDYNYLGARILFVAILTVAAAVGMSCITPATNMTQMKEFLRRVKPFHFGWRPVIAEFEQDYESEETLSRVLWQWLVVTLCALSLIFSIGLLLLGRLIPGMFLLIVFAFSLRKALSEINRQPSIS